MNFKDINVELTEVDEVKKAADKVRNGMEALYQSMDDLSCALQHMGVKIEQPADSAAGCSRR